MVSFVDRRPMNDRIQLSDAVSPTSEIDVMQALSGGKVRNASHVVRHLDASHIHHGYANTPQTGLPFAAGSGRFSLSRSSVSGSMPSAANIVAARSPSGTGSRSG